VSNSPKEEKSGARLGCWLLGLLLVNVVIFGRLAWFWYLSDPIRQLKIGPQTTVIDGPLTAEGYVDYVAALNERASEGVTPENNAVPLLLQAYGPQIISDKYAAQYFALLNASPPIAGGKFLVGESKWIPANSPTFQEFNDRVQIARQRPWTRAEFADIAALVDANAAPLELITQASRRPRFYSPFFSLDEGTPMYAVQLPVEREQREAARQLTLRAMLRLGEGDSAGAWEDLLTCHRLARLTGQSKFFISRLVSVAIDAVACESDRALIASQKLTAEQARQCLRDLQALPPAPSMADLLDTTERWGILDATIQVARKSDSMEGMADGSISTPTISGSIDWNLALQVVNEEFDKTVAAMRLEDTRKRITELDAQGDALHNRSRRFVGMGVRSFLGNRSAASTDMGWTMLQTFMPAARQATVAELRGIARERVVIVGFALAVFYAEHNAYPESLTELVPSVLPQLPRDPWSGQDLIYRRTSDGFVLYSVADDMQDNGGTLLDPQAGNQLFDIVLRVGSE